MILLAPLYVKNAEHKVTLLQSSDKISFDNFSKSVLTLESRFLSPTMTKLSFIKHFHSWIAITAAQTLDVY